MKNYLLSVIICSISIGLCDAFVPKHNGMDRIVKLIGMLIILSVVVSPIIEFVRGFDDGILDSIKEDLIPSDDEYLKEYNLILQEYLNNYSLNEAEQTIKEILKDKYDIKEEECEIIISTDVNNETILLSNIQILLSGEAIFKNPYIIEDYIGKTFNTECQVLIKKR